MKVYTIGRDESCDIIINDPSNTTSRTHAVLKVGKKGKMTIADCSSINGTYVNGKRIPSGVQVPVTRKDVISFAHVVTFDWSFIFTKNTVLRRIAIWSVVGLAVLSAIIGGILFLRKADQEPIPSIEQSAELATAVDSVKVAEPAIPETNKKPASTVKKTKQVPEAETAETEAKVQPEQNQEPEPEQASDPDVKSSETQITNPIF